MEIIRQQLLPGAEAARDTAVIIDVFRAFTCAPLLLHYGARRLLLEQDPARALELKVRHGFLALGEIGGVMVEGFDLGNSPSEIVRTAAMNENFFKGRTVVQRTSAGVRGVFAALETCEQVFAASYTTARAVAETIKRINPAQVHLVAMGENAEAPTPEDTECACYLHHLLDPTQPYEHINSLERILAHESAQKFLRGDKAHYPPADVTWCLQRDVFHTALEAVLTGNGIELKAAIPA
ncbi:MAG: 2-phosphosulfolactate phosphatase [Gemmatimonadota bacterium]|nr:2-phosphosulfolactate phosphatase [Gemmatimonadota bacterium]